MNIADVAASRGYEKFTARYFSDEGLRCGYASHDLGVVEVVGEIPNNRVMVRTSRGRLVEIASRRPFYSTEGTREMKDRYTYVTVKISPETQGRLFRLQRKIHPLGVRGKPPSLGRMIEYLLDTHEETIVTPAKPPEFPGETTPQKRSIYDRLRFWA